MTPSEFISMWQANPLTERAGAQPHFDDLCELLGVEKPRDAENYCFERGAKKSTGTAGWADVWKRDCFAWENKKPGGNLDKALKQLTDYALQLDNPPLLVVCDREKIIIHTAFTGYPDEPREILIEELVDESKRQMLAWVFTNPLKLRPEKSTAAVTEEAASRFAELADSMRHRGLNRDKVAHFLVQCLFCMFAEDEGLLPKSLFSDLLGKVKADEVKANNRITSLFKAMQKPGGVYGSDDIEWFNGGLFKEISVPKLVASDLHTLWLVASEMDWRSIDPTIFGTLFERGLGEARAALGAHYTDVDTIDKLVGPLVRAPLIAEWEQTLQNIKKQIDKSKFVSWQAKEVAKHAKATIAGKTEMQRMLTAAKTKSTKAFNKANSLYKDFLLRLYSFRVLDPACGSGNFLFLALKALRDVEKRVQIEAQDLKLSAQTSLQTGPHNILGLEINEFAAELARVTVWIGDIQWCRQNGWPHALNPVLKPLDGIEHRDALLKKDGTQASWPRADVVVGNPPFIGNRKMLNELGLKYTTAVRLAYENQMDGTDFVCFWFEKALMQIKVGELKNAGLVATNSIRGGANRAVLNRIRETSHIFLAWSDEAWWDNGAAVRVSMIGFGENQQPLKLDGANVDAIYSDLNSDIDVTRASVMSQNLNRSFQGVTPRAELQKTKRLNLGLPNASFNLDGNKARKILNAPATYSGEPMSKVVRPYLIADDITTRPLDRFIVNFELRDQKSSAQFQQPFLAIADVQKNRAHMSDALNYPWWKLWRPRQAMVEELQGLDRYISIPRVAKHHLCVWTNRSVVPGDALVVVARDDDTTIGILQSRLHAVWALRQGTSLGVGNDPRYTNKSCFETFPFPEGLTPELPADGFVTDLRAVAISEAVCDLISQRDHYINPPEWAEWKRSAEEKVASFPERPVAKLGKEDELNRRTLTELYNERPMWLAMANIALDEAVAAAYGWDDYHPQWDDTEILHRLLTLNIQRSAT